jgi:hypothetical protein
MLVFDPAAKPFGQHSRMPEWMERSGYDHPRFDGPGLDAGDG